MATTSLQSGYSGRAEISGEALLLTNYNLTMSHSLIKSKGMYGFVGANKSTTALRTLNRVQGPCFRDMPQLTFSMEFDATLTLLNKMIGHIIDSRNKNLPVTFYDDAHGIIWDFDECYLQSLSLKCADNAQLTIMVELLVRQQSVSFNVNAQTPVSQGFHLPTDAKVLPHYGFNIASSGFNEVQMKDILSFGFTFKQNVIPKYECGGINDEDVPYCTNIVFGLPEIDFDFSCIMANNTSFQFTQKHTIDIPTGSFSLYYLSTKFLTCTGVIVEEITPTVAQSTTHSSYNIRATVCGKISI